jgi:hypothetical protein
VRPSSADLAFSEKVAMVRFITRCHRDKRQGTTAIEAAFVLPVYLLFVLAILEFGHAMMVNNMLRSACRTAARLGSTEGQSTSAVENRVEQVLAAAINPNKVSIFVKNAGVFDEGGAPPTTGSEFEALPDIELSEADSRQMFLVRTKVNYRDVAILPIDVPFLGAFLKNVTLEGQAFMRHE